MGKLGTRQKGTAALDGEQTPVEVNGRTYWRASKRELAQRRADIAKLEPRPEDYVNSAIHLLKLLELDAHEEPVGLKGEALLDWYAENEPSGILDKERAQYQTRNRAMRSFADA